ncbi:MAG TPA: dephospho-CoA kinase [Gammaproteobacteria bacterium]|nr:dephospho-CoA kinase [Gammaproteobacteria bacterium]
MSAPSSPPARSARAFSVGLTGGVASGKSLVAREFVRLGAELVDTDELAREVVAPGEPGLDAVRAEFGPEVLAADGQLDRRALRKLVFDDADKRRRLEALLHPLIRARTLARLEAASGPYVIVAVPLLVETDFGALVDRVLVVDAPEEAQLERLMRRDGLPRAEAAAMIASQAKRAARLAAAHDVIDNGGDERATRAQVERLHRLYLDLASRSPRA